MEDFVVYREHKAFGKNRQKGPEEWPRANELVALHEINEWAVQRFYFDGVVVCDGGQKRYVERVPFELLSIGGYLEMTRPMAAPDVWLQSIQGKKPNIWYRLKKPAPEYRRYHETFLWMAELAKHVVDFLSLAKDVGLSAFRSDFYEWLRELYGPDEVLSRWLSRHKPQDFRHSVASQANFLWCQASQVNADLENQPLWSQIHPRFLTAVAEQIEQVTVPEMFAISHEGGVPVKRRKTTVTPYVYGCFEHLPWAKFLYCQEPSPESRCNGDSGDAGSCHPTNCEALKPRVTDNDPVLDATGTANIRTGDVVALPSDMMTSWKSVDREWYGYVQAVTETKKGLVLDILWLYRPPDTQCLKVPYPCQKELFLSDHCNCGDAPIYAQEVIKKVKVAFHSRSAIKEADYFVRQRYVEADAAWETLKDADFSCPCKTKNRVPQYVVGDTILVKIHRTLQPVVLIEHSPDGLIGRLKVRRLLRRNMDYKDAEAEPNELVFTSQQEIICQANVHRICIIRAYTLEERQLGTIPSPYNRRGTGDFYFITAQDLGDLGLEPLAMSQRTTINEGFDPFHLNSQPAPMTGLDIFCGGGNFGRGLEEAKAVSFDWAVDWNQEAIHTYKANLKDGHEPQLFQGSVNDYLTQAMQGSDAASIAPCGKIEVIAAGSPCQGFSIANPLKGNDRSLFNVSMVASVVAFVDFYRPQYALMENVKGMANGDSTQNILALVTSAFVGMGYQVRTFALDAWSYGSPQSRTRIFISIAAEGLTPMPEPPHSHSHPENVRGSTLAKTANGLGIGNRYTSQTPFGHVTIAEATKDLPKTDARISCISHPDHRMSRTLSTRQRILIGSVPRFPGGASFLSAYKRGYMPQFQIDMFAWHNETRSGKGAKTWQRIRRNALMPTVMTEARPEDGVNGHCLHWDEERLLTVMEARRSQGFPDEEVLIGLPYEQWKIVGNSVARPVALALGLSLREALLSNQRQDITETNNLEGKREPMQLEIEGRMSKVPPLPFSAKELLC